MKTLYLSSVVLSVLITASLFFNYIYQQDRQDVFYFNKTYESDLKQESFILLGISMGVKQDPGLKNAVENNFTNSINQSLKIYKSSGIDLILFDKDCNEISKTSDGFKNLTSLCNRENSGNLEDGSRKEVEGSGEYEFKDNGVKIVDYEGSKVLLKFSQVFEQNSLTYLAVVSYIDEAFFEKYPDLKQVYNKMDVRIKRSSKFWAGFLTSVVPQNSTGVKLWDLYLLN